MSTDNLVTLGPIGSGGVGNLSVNNGDAGIISSHFNPAAKLVLEKVDVTKLHISAEEVFLTFNMKSVQEYLNAMSDPTLTRFIEHCDEVRIMAEKTLLSRS